MIKIREPKSDSPTGRFFSFHPPDDEPSGYTHKIGQGRLVRLSGLRTNSVDVHVHATTPMPFHVPLRGCFAKGRCNPTPRTMMPIEVRSHPTLSEPGRDYPESKRRPITRSLFHLSINCFILSTTPDKSLATSSFLKRITLSPNADNAFSLLASSSRCKS